MHDHSGVGHDHHGHAHHGHDHHGHHDHGVRPFGVAMLVNFIFVLVEAAASFFANSTALLADAGHNLADVAGLALAGGAAWLANRKPEGQRTYGFGKAGVLAALANGLLIALGCGALGWEATRRLGAPTPVEPMLVMATAAAGIAVNFGTALLFARDRKSDLNAHGAFVHLMADAAVSAGVIVAGALTALTGASWIDPAASLLVVAFILSSTLGLIWESLNLALDAAPRAIDIGAVRAHLRALPGVTEVHDLHVWAMTAREPALTAHLIRPSGADDAFLDTAEAALSSTFGIRHVTLQVERAVRGPCAMAHD